MTIKEQMEQFCAADYKIEGNYVVFYNSVGGLRGASNLKYLTPTKSELQNKQK